jgi:hypothetical protein
MRQKEIKKEIKVYIQRGTRKLEKTTVFCPNNVNPAVENNSRMERILTE